ncbi:MAG: uL30 family ribosomal protein [Nanobdellota archaeon]
MAAENNNSKIAIILLRGLVNVSHDVKETLKLLGLHRKFACVIKSDTKEIQGMLKRVKDHVTWGTIDDETYKQLVDSRGVTDSQGNMKRFFRLSPPKGGFERMGTKKHFSQKGALGNRKKKINDLLKRMI